MYNQVFLTNLRSILELRLNITDVKNVCFDLGIEYDNLDGETKSDKIREMILLLKRRERVDELIGLVRTLGIDISKDEDESTNHEVLLENISLDEIDNNFPIIPPPRISNSIAAKIEIALRGKTIALLGPRAVGKTTFGEFISRGSIPNHYEATIGTLLHPGGVLTIKDVSLPIKKIYDLSGGRMNYDLWSSAITDSDIILYFVNIKSIRKLEKETVSRFASDVDFISERLRSITNRKIKIGIIGTHADLDTKYLKCRTPGDLLKYTDEFMSTISLQKLQRYQFSTAYTIGHLTKNLSASRIVYNLISHIIHVKD